MAQEVTTKYYYQIGDNEKVALTANASVEVAVSAVTGAIQLIEETVTKPDATEENPTPTTATKVLTATVTTAETTKDKTTTKDLVITYKVDSTSYELKITGGAQDRSKISVLNAKEEPTVYVEGKAFTSFKATSGADYITVKEETAEQKAGDGADYIYSTAKANVLGESGADTLENTAAGSTLNAGAGNDYVYNTGSNVLISGLGDNDLIESTAKGVTINAGAGNDTVTANGSNVLIEGEAGADNISAQGTGTINAGAGNDLILTYGGYTINAGAGNDTIGLLTVGTNTSNGRVISLDSTSGNNVIKGYDVGDKLVLTADPTMSLSGTNVILTLGSSKTTIEGAVDKTIAVEVGTNAYNYKQVGGSIVNVLSISGGAYTGKDIADYVNNTTADAKITTGAGNDTIINSAKAEIDAGDGADYIVNSGESAIKLGAGNDTIINKAASTIELGSGNNLVINEVTDNSSYTKIVLGSGNNTIKSTLMAEWPGSDSTFTVDGSIVNYKLSGTTYTKTTTDKDKKTSTETWTVNGESLVHNNKTSTLVRKRNFTLGAESSGGNNVVLDYDGAGDVITVVDYDDVDGGYQVTNNSSDVIVTQGTTKLTLKNAINEVISVAHGESTLNKKYAGGVFYNLDAATDDADSINNIEATEVNADDGDDIIINSKESAKITAGAGNDTIYTNAAEIDLTGLNTDKNLVEIKNADATKGSKITLGTGSDTVRNAYLFSNVETGTVVSGTNTIVTEYNAKNATYTVKTTNKDKAVTTVTWVKGTDVVTTTDTAKKVTTTELVHNRTFIYNGGNHLIEDYKTGDVLQNISVEEISTISGGVLVKSTNGSITLGSAQAQDLKFVSNVEGTTQTTTIRLIGNTFYNVLEAKDGTSGADYIINSSNSTLKAVSGEAGDDIIKNMKDGEASPESTNNDDETTANENAVKINGGSGNDTIYNEGAYAEIDGGEGNDLIELRNYVQYTDSSMTTVKANTAVGAGATVNVSDGNDTIKNVYYFSDWAEGTKNGNVYTVSDGAATETWTVNADNVTYKKTTGSSGSTGTEQGYYKLAHNRTVVFGESDGNALLTDYAFGDKIVARGELGVSLNGSDVKLTATGWLDDEFTGTLTLSKAKNQTISVVEDADTYHEYEFTYAGNNLVNNVKVEHYAPEEGQTEEASDIYFGTRFNDYINASVDGAQVSANGDSDGDGEGNDTIIASGKNLEIYTGVGNNLVSVVGGLTAGSDGKLSGQKNVTVHLKDGTTTVRSGVESGKEKDHSRTFYIEANGEGNHLVEDYDVGDVIKVDEDYFDEVEASVNNKDVILTLKTTQKAKSRGYDNDDEETGEKITYTNKVTLKGAADKEIKLVEEVYSEEEEVEGREKNLVVVNNELVNVMTLDDDDVKPETGENDEVVKKVKVSGTASADSITYIGEDIGFAVEGGAGNDTVKVSTLTTYYYTSGNDVIYTDNQDLVVDIGSYSATQSVSGNTHILTVKDDEVGQVGKVSIMNRSAKVGTIVKEGESYYRFINGTKYVDVSGFREGDAPVKDSNNYITNYEKSVDLGDGNNYVNNMNRSLSGSNIQITVGNGKNTILADGREAKSLTIKTGSNANLVRVIGSGEINLGAGNDTVFLEDSSASLNAGAGADFIQVKTTFIEGDDTYVSGPTINAGAGNDTIQNTFMFADFANDTIINGLQTTVTKVSTANGKTTYTTTVSFGAGSTSNSTLQTVVDGSTAIRTNYAYKLKSGANVSSTLLADHSIGSYTTTYALAFNRTFVFDNADSGTNLISDYHNGESLVLTGSVGSVALDGSNIKLSAASVSGAAPVINLLNASDKVVSVVENASTSNPYTFNFVNASGSIYNQVTSTTATSLVGSRFADFISVLNSGSSVDAADGDDFISNSSSNVFIAAGGGNDVILTDAQASDVTIRPASGNDSIQSSFFSDWVNGKVTVTGVAEERSTKTITGGTTAYILKKDGTTTTNYANGAYATINGATVMAAGRTILISADDGNSNIVTNWTANDKIVVDSASASTLLTSAAASGSDIKVTYGQSAYTLQNTTEVTIVEATKAGGDTEVTTYEKHLVKVGNELVNVINTTLGSELNDSIVYTDGGDKYKIEALGGNDYIYTSIAGGEVDAGAGNDTIIADADNVTVKTGAGNDIVKTSGSGDVIEVNAGGATISALDSNATLDRTFIFNSEGETANVVITDYAAGEVLDFGTNATNVKVTTSGNNINLSVEKTTVVLNGAKSNPFTVANGTNATVKAYGGTILYNVYGEPTEDNKITASSEADSILVNTSGVTVDGRKGNDLIYLTEAAADAIINAGEGNDTIYNNLTENGTASINGGGDDDIIINSGKNATIAGGAGNDTIRNATVEANGEQVELNNRTIILNSGDGNDVVEDYQTGDLIVIGQAEKATVSAIGNTAYVKVNNAQLSLLNAKGNTISIKGSTSGTQTLEFLNDGTFINYETITATPTDNKYILGGFLDNVNVTASNFTLETAEKSDTIFSSGSNVYIDAGDDADLISNTGKGASLIGNSGNDTIYNSGTNVLIKGGSGADYIYDSGARATIEVSGADRIETDGVGGRVYEVETVTSGVATILGYASSDSIILAGEASLTAEPVSVSGGSDVSIKAGQQTLILKEALDKTIAVGNNTYAQASGIFYNQVTNANGGAGNDSINITSEFSGSSVDAGGGNDIIYINKGDIKANGGAGNDRFVIGEVNGVTINGGAGDDTYSYADTAATNVRTFVFEAATLGADVITDYAADKLKIKDTTITASALTVSNNDVKITVGKGSVTLKDAKAKTIEIEDSIATYNYTYDETSRAFINTINLGSGGTNKLITGTASADLITVEEGIADVVTVKAGAGADTINAKSKAVIYGEGDGDVISLSGSAAESTIYAGAGNDTIYLNSATNVRIVQESGGGKDNIVGYKAGDVIELGSGVSLTKVAVNNKNVVLTTSGGDITLVDASGTAITTSINGKESSQVYGMSAITVGAGDGDTVDLSLNTDVKTISIDEREGGAYVIANANANSIVTHGDDTLTGGAGNDTFNLTEGGAEVITDWTTGANVMYVGAVKGGSISGQDVIIEHDADKEEGEVGGKVTLKGAASKTITIYEANASLTSARVYNATTFRNGQVVLDSSASDKGYETEEALSQITAAKLTNKQAIAISAANATSVIGGAGADTLEGKYVSGGSGNDILKGYTLTGGAGSDTFVAGLGSNLLITDYKAAQDVVDIGESRITGVAYAGTDAIATLANEDSEDATKTTTMKLTKGAGTKVTYVYKEGTNALANTMTIGKDGKASMVAAKTDAATINASRFEPVSVIDVSGKAEGTYVIGNEQNNVIKGSKYNDTILAGGASSTLGNTLTGGAGADVFIYGGSNVLITDYSNAQGDVISLDKNEYKLSGYSISGKDVLVTVEGAEGTAAGVITVKNAKDAEISFSGVTGLRPAKLSNGTTVSVYNEKGEKVFTNKDGITNYVADSDVVTIDASKSTQAISIKTNEAKAQYVKANSKVNVIDLTYENAVAEGIGQDTIATGGGRDTILVNENTQAIITDYTAGSDVISLASGVSLTGYGYSNDKKDVIFTVSNDTGKGHLQLTKGMGKNVMISDGQYGTYTVNFSTAAKKGTTLTLSATAASAVTVTQSENGVIYNTVNASGRSNKQPIEIKGTEQGETIKGGKGNDIIDAYQGNDQITSGAGADTIVIGVGKDTITDYAAGDILKIDGYTGTETNGNALKITGSETGTGKRLTLIIGTSKEDTLVSKANNYVQLTGAASKEITITSADGSDKQAMKFANNQAIITVTNAMSTVKSEYAAADYTNILANENMVKTITASGAKHAVKLTAAEGGTSLTGGSQADTLEGKAGNDWFKGGNGEDVFISGGGNDTIADYTASDIVSLTGGQHVDKVEILNKNIRFTVDSDVDGESGTITVVNGKGKAINLTKGEKSAVFSYTAADTGVLTITKTMAEAKTSYEAAEFNGIISSEILKTMTASGAKVAVELKGNEKGNAITGSAYNDTLTGGTGNDTFKGAGGTDTYIYSGGNDVITDYTAGETIQLGERTIQSTRLNGKNLVITTADGTITLTNGKGKRVTTEQGTYIYGDGSTATLNIVDTDLPNAMNSTAENVDGNIKVNMIDATKVKSAGLTLTTNSAVNTTIKGGSQADELVATGAGSHVLSGGGGTDTYDLSGVDTGGKVTISGFANNEIIKGIDESQWTVDGSAVVFNTSGGGKVTVTGGKGKTFCLGNADNKVVIKKSGTSSENVTPTQNVVEDVWFTEDDNNYTTNSSEVAEILDNTTAATTEYAAGKIESGVDLTNLTSNSATDVTERITTKETTNK